MSSRNLAFAILAGLGLAGVAASLLVSGRIGIVLAVLIALAAIAALFRPTLRSSGIACAYGVAAFTPWNGWTIGPIKPGDALIFAALLCFFAADVGWHLPAIPWWAVQLGGVIVLVTALHEVFPTDPHYLAQRVVVDTAGRPFQEFTTNIGVGAKYLIPVVFIPIVFGFATMHDRRVPRRLAIAFAAGTSLSGLVGFTDGQGITALGPRLTRDVFFGVGRAAGFANHPNFLAATCVLSWSFVLWLLVQDRFSRRLGLLVAPGILLGTYASGSRGGALCVVIATVLSVLMIPAYRRRLGDIALVAAILGAVGVIIAPGVGYALLKAMRLVGETNAEGSDTVRALVAEQGLNDFRFSPFDGVGMQVAAEAHNVYIQALATGGVLLFGSFLLYTAGALLMARSLWRYDSLVAPTAATLGTGVVFAALENTMTDRFVYVPPGILAALATRRWFEQQRTGAAPVDGSIASWLDRQRARTAPARTRPTAASAGLPQRRPTPVG